MAQKIKSLVNEIAPLGQAVRGGGWNAFKVKQFLENYKTTTTAQHE